MSREFPTSQSLLLFFDIDGTLVTYENVLPDSVAPALAAAKKRGHIIIFNTGRSKAEMPDNIMDLKPDAYIGANGAYIERAGEVLFHNCLTQSEEKEIVAWLQKRGHEFYLEANDGLFASENFREAAQGPLLQYAKGKGVELPAGTYATDELMHGMVYDADLEREGVNKISFIVDGIDDVEVARHAFPKLKVGSWGGKGEHVLFGDIGPFGITKSEAAQKVAAAFGCGLDTAVAFGDAKVDIDMLEACAYGVSFESAGAEIKAMADYIAPAVDEDGLAIALKDLGITA